MMYTENNLVMYAPLEAIFQAAAEVEHWPHILKHYRYVVDRPPLAGKRVVAMSAYRDFIPTSWTSTQELVRPSESERPAVVYHHIRGVTRGMAVEWTFHQQPDGVLVRITHEHPNFRYLFLVGWPAQKLIGETFVENIADKTLRGIKAYVERNASK